MFRQAKMLFPLAWMLIAIALIVTIKWIVPHWVSFHIAIAVVLILIIATSMLHLWNIYSRKWVYSLLIVILSIAPVIIGIIAERNIDQAVCFLRGSSNFNHLMDVQVNQDVVVCGYFGGCSSAYFGQDRHVWEVCQIIDPTNAEQSILIYTYDITINLDNPFDWSSLDIYSDGTLVVETGRLVNIISRESCPADLFCNGETLPIAEIIRN